MRNEDIRHVGALAGQLHALSELEISRGDRTNPHLLALEIDDAADLGKFEADALALREDLGQGHVRGVQTQFARSGVDESGGTIEAAWTQRDDESMHPIQPRTSLVSTVIDCSDGRPVPLPQNGTRTVPPMGMWALWPVGA